MLHVRENQQAVLFHHRRFVSTTQKWAGTDAIKNDYTNVFGKQYALQIFFSANVIAVMLFWVLVSN